MLSRSSRSEAAVQFQAFEERGVPDSRIYCDCAGFRTLDSVVRRREVFGQQSFTIISQPFHNERAVYLARGLGMDEVAFNAQDISRKYSKTLAIREFLAKPLAIVDVCIHCNPKFLGKRIEIPA